jgi:UDP-N-acetylmuramate dehydrogenase
MNISLAYEELLQYYSREQILQNESMKNHTSFRIGGKADLLVIPSSADQIRKTVTICRDMNIPVMIMGNGSNLLVRDSGIRGVVIKIADGMKEITVEKENIKAQAGALLSAVSSEALRHRLIGMEFASGIPGTIGGAVIMNAGAYDGEMKDVVEGALVMDEYGQEVSLSKGDLEFGYRTSSLQKKFYVVLEVTISLKSGDYEKSKAKIADFARRRREKQPLSYPSAGSVFKRPPGYYAGQLIQDCGLKGMRIGDAQISELHSGFIINLGNATAKDVIKLINIVRERVIEKFNVEMHPEIRIVGDE